MKTSLTLAIALTAAGIAQAALKPGDSLSAYEIKNVATGKEYCQVCEYGSKAKIVAFGKLNDEKFWADLKKLNELHKNYEGKNLGIFAHIIDSTDTDAVKAAAKEHGIDFPVVVTAEADWNRKYKVNGVSRTIYYAPAKNKIAWTAVGLDGKAATDLKKALDKDLHS
jgi:hypothetical protein